MTLGPTIILKIPLSDTLVKMSTTGSGNTFGARYWTDGKQEAPMLPDRPWLRRHPKTGELFWTDECKKIAEESPWEGKDNYRKVPYAESPSLEDYRQAMVSGIASTPEKQRYVLMRYWWAANDPVRRGDTSVPSPYDLDERLLQFLALLDTKNPNQRLMAAEVARQLRDFTKAVQLLKFRFPKNCSHAVKLIKKLASEENSTVHQLA